MFENPLKRFLRRVSGSDIPVLIQQANRALEADAYEKAAEMFLQLARKNEELAPHRAPFLHIESGRAAILGGQTAQGIARFRSGLTLLASQQRFARLRSLGEGIEAELCERDLETEAQEIEALVESNLPFAASAEPIAPAKKPLLPTHCPSCGAGMKPYEIEWLGDLTAKCAYCGSPVRGNSRRTGLWVKENLK